MRLVIIIVILLVSVFSSAREYPMLHYSKENGLPSNTVYSIYRDSKGFIWFGTDKGIAKYNGISFKIYTTADGLPDNEVFFFQEDYQGRLWMGTFNGAICYYQHGVFHSSKNTPFLRHVLNIYNICQIIQEPDSSLTFHSGGYIQSYFINIKNNKATVYNLVYPKDHHHEILWNMHKVSDTVYQLFYENQDCIYHVNTNIISRENTHKTLRYSFNQDQRFFYDEHLIRSPDEKLHYLFNPSFKQFRDVNKIYYDSVSFLIATDLGLFVNNNESLLTGIRTTSVTQDITGSYWVSTLGNGVWRLNQNFHYNKLIKNAFKGIVRFAFQHKGFIYFVTSARHLYRFDHNRVDLVLSFADQYIPPKQNVNMGCAIHNENFYAVDGIGNFHSLNLDNGSLQKYHYEEMGFIKFLLAGTDGLYMNNGTSISYIQYPLRASKFLLKNNNSSDRIFFMTVDPEDNIWYSKLNGIYTIANHKPVLQSQFDSIGFKWFKIFNNYLIGVTHTNMLLICRNYNTQIHIDTLHNSSIWEHAYPLDSNHVLLATNNLYNVLTIPADVNKAVSIHAVENPFVPKDAEYFIRDSTGLFFFKEEAITMLTKEDLNISPPAPIIFFKNVTTKDSIYKLEGKKVNELTIPYKQAANIHISFEALSFSGADILYEYTVAGDEADNWQPIVNNELTLVAPHYGMQLIKIHSKTLSSSYSIPTTLTLYISKPFWATWWFIIISFLIIATGVTLAIRFFIKRTLRRREREHNNKVRVLKSEFKALNALMNPHFIFNALNSVQGLINNNEQIHASEYLRTFSDLVRQNMQNISHELIPLQKEINLVANYLKLEKLRFKDLLHYEIEINPSVDPDEYMIPPLLIQPFVENSIKHGLFHRDATDSYVHVTIYEKETCLVIEITDNGIGFSTIQKADIQHESFGLENIRQRIKQLAVIHSMEISFEITELHGPDNAVLGTKVTVNIHYKSG